MVTVAQSLGAAFRNARKYAARAIIQDCLERAHKLRVTYFEEHPRARYLSESTQGAAWACEITAQAVCRQYIGHQWQEVDIGYRWACQVCRGVRFTAPEADTETEKGG